MPAKSEAQRRLVFVKRNLYKTKKDTPKKWIWVWEKDMTHLEDMGDQGLPGAFPGNSYEPYDMLMNVFFPSTLAKVFFTDDYYMNKERSMVEDKIQLDDNEILKNPDREELLSYARLNRTSDLRGAEDYITGDIYIVDSYSMTHTRLLSELKVKSYDDYGFFFIDLINNIIRADWPSVINSLKVNEYIKNLGFSEFKKTSDYEESIKFCPRCGKQFEEGRCPECGRDGRGPGRDQAYIPNFEYEEKKFKYYHGTTEKNFKKSKKNINQLYFTPLYDDAVMYALMGNESDFQGKLRSMEADVYDLVYENPKELLIALFDKNDKPIVIVCESEEDLTDEYEVTFPDLTLKDIKIKPITFDEYDKVDPQFVDLKNYTGFGGEYNYEDKFDILMKTFNEEFLTYVDREEISIDPSKSEYETAKTNSHGEEPRGFIINNHIVIFPSWNLIHHRVLYQMIMNPKYHLPALEKLGIENMSVTEAEKIWTTFQFGDDGNIYLTASITNFLSKEEIIKRSEILKKNKILINILGSDFKIMREDSIKPILEDKKEYLVNPDREEIADKINSWRHRRFEARGILDTRSGDVFIWDALRYTHHDMYEFDEIPENSDYIQFQLKNRTIYTSNSQDLNELEYHSPNIRRLGVENFIEGYPPESEFTSDFESKMEDKTYLEFTKKEILDGVDDQFYNRDTYYKDLKVKLGSSGIYIKKFYPKYVEFQIKSATKSGKLYDARLYFSEGFKYLQKNFKFNEYNIEDPQSQKTLVEDIQYYIEDIIDNGDIQLYCSCPSFLYHGFKYIATELDYEEPNNPENRFPKVRNPEVKGTICKHLQLLLNRIDSNSSFKQLIVKAMTGEFLKAEINRRYSHSKQKPDWWKQYIK